MPNFCLIPSVAEKFKQDMISGEVDPVKLAEMTSVERHAFFADKLGESNAKAVNALFESKMILKNQQQGYINWAKKVTGISKEVRRDIISRIERMDKILSPTEEEAFLNDLVDTKLGVNVTFDEAQKIAELSKKVEDMANTGDRLDSGRAKIELRNYYNKLKLDANKLEIGDVTKDIPGSIKKLGMSIAGNTKAIKASMDNSAIFRQGWKTLWSNPVIWAKNATKSFSDIARTFGGKEVLDELDADIVSRPTYPLMQKAKLAVGVLEEEFPTALPEKIPVLGKIYKASEVGYTAFVRKTRADVFDKMIEIAQDTGVELNNEELISIGKMVNSLTGRGNLGSIEPVANVLNNFFFSPRMIKSHIDTLTQPFTGAGGSNFVRKQAALNLLKIVMGTAFIMGIAKVLKKDSVELDPRSSDFGKIKIGNTRFDVTGGMDSILTLSARELTRSTKSTATGNVTKLNEKNKDGTPKFGAQSGTDVIYNFFENKLSPIASVVKDLAKDQMFDGSKPTILKEVANLTVPLPITTGVELYKTPGAANVLLGLIADGLGIATNTYAPPAPKPKKTLKTKSTNPRKLR